MPSDPANSLTHSHGIQATCIVFLVLVVFTIAIRLYTRAHVTFKFGLDDAFALISAVFTVGALVLSIYAAYNCGWTLHPWELSPALYRKSEQASFIYNFLFSLSATLTKLSVLWFSRRLLGSTTSNSFFRPQFVVLMVLMAIVGIGEIIYVVMTCLECRPLKVAWDPHPDYPYTCINIKTFLMASGVLNTITDFGCTVLPAIIVMKLHMPWRQKAAVASLFLLGVSVNIASALRLYYVYIQFKAGARSEKVSYVIAGAVEIGLGLICVNLPSLRPLFVRYANYLRSYTRTRGSEGVVQDYFSPSRSRQIQVSDRLAGSHDPAHPQIQTFSAVGRADPYELKGKGGIEVTRTVELDGLDQAPSHSRGVHRGRNMEWPSQEALVKDVS